MRDSVPQFVFGDAFTLRSNVKFQWIRIFERFVAVGASIAIFSYSMRVKKGTIDEYFGTE